MSFSLVAPICKTPRISAENYINIDCLDGQKTIIFTKNISKHTDQSVCRDGRKYAN